MWCLSRVVFPNYHKSVVDDASPMYRVSQLSLEKRQSSESKVNAWRPCNDLSKDRSLCRLRFQLLRGLHLILATRKKKWISNDKMLIVWKVDGKLYWWHTSTLTSLSACPKSQICWADLACHQRCGTWRSKERQGKAIVIFLSGWTSRQFDMDIVSLELPCYER